MSLSHMTVDEKLDLLTNKKAAKLLEETPVQEIFEQDIIQKKVKKVVEVSEDDVIGVNALREIMLREKSRQFEENDFYQLDFNKDSLTIEESNSSEESDPKTDSQSENPVILKKIKVLEIFTTANDSESQSSTPTEGRTPANSVKTGK
eukprot:CAMPEP_0176465990 /NCGR_PEP_ID=MMETSP0127-20121128/37620_1 /TAXON_ID=938130 /ORGANISM="Platyophrya macrostoma, Strain WH" /LENGTH=147 /DNA_ID=CAMNT_0017859061 /DNA_START=73 /DNA_END=516 /DNA_ORIENTATION=+